MAVPLEVIGTPVASGILDPTNTFITVGIILIIGSIAFGIWKLLS